MGAQVACGIFCLSLPMKTFVTLCLAVCLSFVFVEQADAKRFGGGGFGKAFKTSPFKKSSPLFANKQSQGNKSALAGKQRPRSGMMGGLMGGLLAGGMFAYLMGNGAFEGLQMMDMIIFGLLAFVLFKLFKGSRATQQRTSYAGFPPQNQSQAWSSNDSATGTAETETGVPFILPEDFDVPEFEKGALEHFRLVNQAWDEGDLSTIEEYLHSSVYQQLMTQRQGLAGRLQNDILDLEAQLVRAEPTENGHCLSVLFRGLVKDADNNEETGIFDVWHLEKEADGPWLIVGIEAQ